MNEKNRNVLLTLAEDVQTVVEKLMSLHGEIEDELVRTKVCLVAAFLMTARRSMRHILQEDEEDET